MNGFADISLMEMKGVSGGMNMGAQLAKQPKTKSSGTTGGALTIIGTVVGVLAAVIPSPAALPMWGIRILAVAGGAAQIGGVAIK
jgi:hypothetical protein